MILKLGIIVVVVFVELLGAVEHNEHIADIIDRRMKNIISAQWTELETKFNSLFQKHLQELSFLPEPTQEVEILSKRFQEMESDLKTLLKDHTDLKERFFRLDKDNVALKKLVTSLQQKNEDLEKQFSIIGKETESVKSSLYTEDGDVSGDTNVSPENSSGDFNSLLTKDNLEKRIIKKTVHLPDLPLTTTAISPIYMYPQVAFHARLSQNLNAPANNQLIMFEDVSTNIGNGFSASTSTFVCHVTGTYVLSVTLVTNQGKYLDAEVIVNDNIAAVLFVRESSSSTIVQGLQNGDEVWVRVRSSDPDTLAYGYWSTFSGFILWPKQ